MTNDQLSTPNPRSPAPNTHPEPGAWHNIEDPRPTVASRYFALTLLPIMPYVRASAARCTLISRVGRVHPGQKLQ